MPPKKIPDATAIIIDAGLIGNPLSFSSNAGDSTKFDAMIARLQRHLCYCMNDTSAKQDEFSFYLSGKSDFQRDSSIANLSQLNKASKNMCKALQHTVCDGSKPFEMVKAMSCAIGDLEQRVEETGHKITPKMIVITDCSSTNRTPNESSELCELLESVKIHGPNLEISFLVVDPADKFTTRPFVKMEAGRKGELSDEDLVMMFKAGGIGQVHLVDSWESLNASFQNKSNMTTAKLSEKKGGALHLSSKLSIPVVTYAKTMANSMPTATKFSTLAKDEVGKVDIDTVYLSVDDVNEIIHSENIIKAYEYGGEFIPIAASDETSLETEADPGLTVLGYCNASEVPLQCVIEDSVDVVVPVRGNQRAEFALAAFHRALVKKQSVALVRYVKSRAKSAPTMGILKPSKGSDSLLYLCKVPFDEDSRRFPFDPLPTSDISDEDLNVALSVVDAMNLVTKKTSHEIPFEPARINNPVVEHFRTLLMSRAIDPDTELPGTMDQSLLSCYEANHDMMRAASADLERFKQKFPITHKASKSSNKERWGDTVAEKTSPKPKEPTMVETGTAHGSTAPKEPTAVSAPSNANDLFGTIPAEPIPMKSEDIQMLEYANDDTDDDMDDLA